MFRTALESATNRATRESSHSGVVALPSPGPHVARRSTVALVVVAAICTVGALRAQTAAAGIYSPRTAGNSSLVAFGEIPDPYPSEQNTERSGGGNYDSDSAGGDASSKDILTVVGGIGVGIVLYTLRAKRSARW